MATKHGVTDIPPRFIRKAWYLIIDHLVQEPHVYTQYFLPGFKNQKFPGSLLEWPVIKNEPRDFHFYDEDEQLWFKDGLMFNGKPILVKYERVYKIEGYIAAFCQAINAVSKIGKNPKELTAKRKLIDHKIKKGSVVQTVLHARLSAYDMRDSEVYFEDTEQVISMDTAKNTLKYADEILDKLYPGDLESINAEREVLSALREELARFADPELKHQSPGYSFSQVAVDKHNNFWRAGDLLSGLQESNWLVFERTDGRGKSRADQGIAINAFMFHKMEDGYLACEMYNTYHDTDETLISSHYKGLAAIGEEDKYIHIELHRSPLKVMPSAAFFTIRRSDNKNQNLFIGHYNYYSIRKKRYLSKTTVWLKFKHGTNSITPNQVPEPNILPEFLVKYTKNLDKDADAASFEEIPPKLRLFLDARYLNRLPMPQDALSYFDGKVDSLEDFIKDKYGHVENEIVLQNCCTKYAVCYYSENLEIKSNAATAEIIGFTKIGLLELKYDKVTLKFESEYIHYTDKEQIYKGQVYRKDNTIEVIAQNEPDMRARAIESNFVFITFSIPHHDRNSFERTFKEENYFTGILTGLNDGNHNPVSYFVVLVKEEMLVPTTGTASAPRLNEAGQDIVSLEFRKKSRNMSIKILK